MKQKSLTVEISAGKAAVIAVVLALLIVLTVTEIIPVFAREVKPISDVYVRKSNRDPFVPPRVEEKKPLEPVKQKEATIITVKDGQKVKPAKKEPAEPQVVRVDSGLSVTGIVATNRGYQAIINAPGGRSYMVSQGQKLGDWTVSSITRKNVTIKCDNRFDLLELKKK